MGLSVDEDLSPALMQKVVPLATKLTSFASAAESVNETLEVQQLSDTAPMHVFWTRRAAQATGTRNHPRKTNTVLFKNLPRAPCARFKASGHPNFSDRFSLFVLGVRIRQNRKTP